MSVNKIKQELKKLANPQKAKIYARFFKTGKGEYGEGDKFLGVAVPEQRKVAKKYSETGLADLRKLLESSVHEHRVTAVMVLVGRFHRASEKEREEIYRFYFKNLKHINNWDLVDGSAPKIVGEYLLDKKRRRKILYKLARSKNLWERRIAIMATLGFIKNGEFEDALKISRILLNDEHDLIHKAVGWMLREIGKKNQEKEEDFLKRHVREMPRTMLRYAIEKFDERKRKPYLRH